MRAGVDHEHRRQVTNKRILLDDIATVRIVIRGIVRRHEIRKFVVDRRRVDQVIGEERVEVDGDRQ